MKPNNRHGGARPNSGPKKKDPKEKKVTVAFYIKRKHVEKAKAKIKPIVDKINSQS
jgi:hypothetical protein